MSTPVPDHAATARRSLERDPLRRALRKASALSPAGARGLVAYDRRRDTGVRRSWYEVAALLAAQPPTRISVDVFDTVLTRRVVGDEALWWIVGTALARDGVWQGSTEDFVRARRAAAQGHPNGTLEDIYAAHVLGERCPPASGWSAEYAVELMLTVPLTGARESLQQLRAAGHRLTFLSDMHLSRSHLGARLREHGLMTDDDELVISSEARASKWDGTLFRQLARDPVAATEWHIGNDLWSDVAMAERAGLRALPLRRGEPTALERAMDGRPGSSASAIAGAALAVRSSEPPDGAVPDALWEVGADVAGQCLSAFLLWIREHCARLDVQQVLFLARDGELPLRMAEAMPEDHWRGIGLTYLHGSRRMWSVAAAAALGVDTWLAAGTADAAAFLRQGENLVPWESLLGRVALGPEDLAGSPALARLPPDRPLPASRTPAWHALLRQPAVRQKIAERAREQHLAVRDHVLSQWEGGRVVVVDVGWRGQLAWHISAVLRDVTGQDPVHLHFGGVDVASNEADQVDIRRFAVDDSREPLPFPDVVSCVETITASGGARAHSVERGPDGAVRLVLELALPDMDTEHRRRMWRSAVAVAGALPSRGSLQEWGLSAEDLDRSVRGVLSDFWLRPDRVHATAATHLAAEVDDAGTVQPVARPYAVARGGGGGGRTWRQGSLRLTGPGLRTVLALVLRLRDRRA